MSWNGNIWISYEWAGCNREGARPRGHVYYFIKETETGHWSSLFKCLPTQLVQQWSGTSLSGIIVRGPPGCSSLDCFNLMGLLFKISSVHYSTRFWPRQANLVLIAYASSEGSGKPAHARILARTSAARSYKQWVKRNLQTESQIPGPSEWLGMRS